MRRGVGVVALATVLGGCAGASTGDGCPRSTAGDWRREEARAPDFALSLCIPPGWRRAGELAWERRSAGATLVVSQRLLPARAEAVLSPCRELGVGCAVDPVVAQLRRRLFTLQRRVAVLETGVVSGGEKKLPRTTAALLRVELGPDEWVVVRGARRDSTRLPQLVRALESVRIERVGRAP